MVGTPIEEMLDAALRAADQLGVDVSRMAMRRILWAALDAQAIHETNPPSCPAQALMLRNYSDLRKPKT